MKRKIPVAEQSCGSLCSRNRKTLAIKEGKTLRDVTVEEFKSFSKYFNANIYDLILPKKIVNEKISYGGTSKNSVNLQIAKLKKLVKK